MGKRSSQRVYTTLKTVEAAVNSFQKLRRAVREG